MDIIFLLASLGLIISSGYGMIKTLIGFSFDRQIFFVYLTTTVILFIIILLIGIILNGKFKRILTGFLNKTKDSLQVTKGSLRTYGLLQIVLLPFLLYLFIFSLFAVIDFVLYGYIAINNLPRIPIGLLIGLAIVGVGSVISILIGLYYLFFSSRKESAGIIINPNQEKKLWNVVNEVSEEMGTKVIDKIIITPDTGIGVYLEGAFIKTMFGGGKRVLEIGLPGIYDFTIDEFKAILGHEYGHFNNKDTQRLSFTYVMGNSLTSALSSMPGPSRSKDTEQSWITLVMFLNPAYWILSLYVKLYFFITNGFSRIGEVRSDVISMNIYGGKSFRDGLIKTAINGIIFSEIIENQVLELIKKEKIISDFSTCMGLAYKEIDKKTLNSFKELVMDKSNSSDIYDSHPATNIRVEYSKRFDKKISEDKTIINKLFDKWSDINEKVADIYNERLIRALQALAKEETKGK